MSDIKDEIRNRWFENHVADFSIYKDENGNELRRLFWHKPDTFCCHVNYTIDGGTLIVTGDLGNAVYRWSGAISFESIAGYDFSYRKRLRKPHCLRWG